MRLNKAQVLPRQQCAFIHASSKEQCKSLSKPGKDRCHQHQRNQQGVERQPSGLYSHVIDSNLKTIYAEVEKQGKIDELKRPGLEEELAISRVQLMALLQEASTPTDMRLKALETVARIARTSKAIKEIDASVMRQDFLDSIMNAVTYAFHRANAIIDPADRARVFVSELALWFPAVDATGAVVPDKTIEGEVLALPSGDE